MNVCFARYYDDEELVKIEMNQIEAWILSEDNKNKIADAIYYRLYERFLKIFFYQETKKTSNFNRDYKSGFIIMASSCLLIETLAAFIQGNNETIGTGNANFQFIFNKAQDYESQLDVFKGENIYSKIRNGVLHQGETKGGFLIRREGELFDGVKTINATKFAKELKNFLCGYISDLKNSPWDSGLWEKCRQKLTCIIENASNGD